MNGPGEARQWGEAVSHLVRAHGAEPGRLTGFVYPLGDVRFIHLDTHAALSIIGQRPADRHIHPAAENPRSLSQLSSGFMPFPDSPSTQEAGGHQYGKRSPLSPPCSTVTGLPQTGVQPGADADLADWASAALRILLEIYRENGTPGTAAAAARIRADIGRPAAEGAAGYWQAVTTEPAAPEFIWPWDTANGPPPPWPAGAAVTAADAARLTRVSFPGPAQPALSAGHAASRRPPQPVLRAPRGRRR
jgi:hypothetical protein